MPRKTDAKTEKKGGGDSGDGRAGAGRAKARRKISKKDLDEFRGALLSRRARLVGDVGQMTEETLLHGSRDVNGDVSTMPTHMADLGTDNYNREFTVELLEGEREEIKAIDQALTRVDDGSFGTCKECGKRIRKVRLRALPHAPNCIDCQRQKESG